MSKLKDTINGAVEIILYMLCFRHTYRYLEMKAAIKAAKEYRIRNKNTFDHPYRCEHW